jgi:hypothetical protein
MSAEEPRLIYYAVIPAGRTRETPTDLIRRTQVGPSLIDEELRRDGRWHPSDFLDRYHMLGSTDIPYQEITAEEAARIIARWRAQGLIAVFKPGSASGH